MTSRLQSLTVVVFAFLVLEGMALAGTKILDVHVSVVCATDGTNCASLGPNSDPFYSVASNAIWAQADIEVRFYRDWLVYDSSFLTIDDAATGSTFFDLSNTWGHGATSNIVDLFVTHTIVGAYGEGWLGYGGLVIGMDDVLGYATGDPAYPNGRIDTIAHELGHNLGLYPLDGPDSDGAYHALNPDYLMAPGYLRNVPGSVADVAPNGSGYDVLTADQIRLARASALLYETPEPSSAVLLLSGAVLLLGRLRRA